MVLNTIKDSLELDINTVLKYVVIHFGMVNEMNIIENATKDYIKRHIKTVNYVVEI